MTELRIRLNGEEKQILQGDTISKLVAEMGVTGRYAVELNGEIVPKSEHSSKQLVEADRIEIVQAIGGG